MLRILADLEKVLQGAGFYQPLRVFLTTTPAKPVALCMNDTIRLQVYEQ